MSWGRTRCWKPTSVFIPKALHGQKLPVRDPGMNMRDWLYAKDNYAAIDSSSPV
jgi:dTDP-glucose 4,6-dehydratase (EC 4.2.1.46)